MYERIAQNCVSWNPATESTFMRRPHSAVSGVYFVVNGEVYCWPRATCTCIHAGLLTSGKRLVMKPSSWCHARYIQLLACCCAVNLYVHGRPENWTIIKGFYSASALLARGILSVCLSVCPSVRPSVTFRYCVQTNEDTIVRFSASGRTIPLVSGE